MKSRRRRLVGGVALAIAAALVAGSGRVFASIPDGQRGDGVVDIHVGGRDLIIHTDGVAINGLVLTSDAGLLTGEPYAGGMGLFVTDDDWMLADQLGYVLAGPHDLGRVLAGEVDLAILGADLTLSYTLEGQAGVALGTIMQAVPGDADLDGLVGYWDLSRMLDTFGASTGALWVDADFTGDGAVSSVDYIAMKSNFGYVAALAPPVNAGGAAPEPASLAILAVGACAALAEPGRRRNRTNVLEQPTPGAQQRSER
jgi:hypothetical protein